MLIPSVERLKADDAWTDQPLHRRDDWKREVQDGNTQRGYWDWVEALIQQESERVMIGRTDPQCG